MQYNIDHDDQLVELSTLCLHQYPPMHLGSKIVYLPDLTPPESGLN